MEVFMSSPLDAALEEVRRKRQLPSPDRCRQLRVNAGISQTAIAETIGVTRAAISRYESGDRAPSGKNLARYETVLKRLAKETEEAK
jgi:HTH-type transcriptional regulator/antitoxin MqsA